MQTQKDAYIMPIGKNVKLDNITIDELLLESDFTRDLEKQIQLSKQNRFDPTREMSEDSSNGFTKDRRTTFQLQDMSQRAYVNIGEIKITEDDLMIEEILGRNGSSAALEQVLRDIDMTDLDMNDLLDVGSDRSSLQKIIQEESQPPKEEQEPTQYIIDYVDLLERQPYTFLAKSAQQEHESFLFTHYEEQLRKERIESFRQLPDLRLKQMQKIQNQFTHLHVKLKQTHRCLQYYIDTQREFLSVGFSRASIVLFILKCPVPFTAGQEIILPQDSSIRPSSMVSIEFTDKYQTYESSRVEAQFLFYSLQTPTNPKLLKTFSGVHGSCPLAFQIFGEQMNTTNYLNFVSCDLQGTVQTNRIRHSTFSYGIEKNILLNQPNGIIYQLSRQLIKLPKNLVIEVVATASKMNVQVIVMEPFIDIVFKKDNTSNSPSLVRWHSSPQDTLLMIANGCELQLLALICTREHNKVDIKFEIRSHLVLRAEVRIDALHWLSANIIFVKVDRLEYYLIDTQRFQTTTTSHGFDDGVFKAALVAQGLLETELADQKYSWEKQAQLSTFTNTIVSRSNKIVFLEASTTSSRFYVLLRQLSVWHEFIEVKIDSRDWNYCLALLLQMYNGNARYFADLPTDDKVRKAMMLPYLNEFVIRYIQYVAEFDRKGDNEKQEYDSWKNNTTRAIEFLTKAKSLNFLFTSLRSLLKKLHKDQIFLDSLEPFILRNEINFIPREALKDVFTNLKEQRKLQTLKQLIINLDIMALDQGQVVSICIQFNLYTPLIYICPRVDEDYFTPIVKMFATYTNLLQEYDNSKAYTLDQIKTQSSLTDNKQNHIQQYLMDQQITDPRTSQEMLKEIRMQGYRCLWYIHLCFMGQLFPHDSIPRNTWGKVLTHLIIWVFAEETLTVLLSLNAYVCFNEILLLFNQPQIDALRMHQDETIRSLCESFKKDKKANQTITLTILDILSHQIPEHKYQDVFRLFLSEALILCPLMEPEFAIPAINHMLRHPYQSLEQECLMQSYMFLQDNKKITLSDNEATLIKKENAICSYLILHREVITKHDLDEILSNAQESPFVEVRCQVHFIRNQYNQCVDQFIHSTQPQQRMKVFGYIDRFFRTIQDLKLKQSLMAHLLTNIRELVVIDPERMSDILDQYREEDFKEAILRLNEFPQLKFRLLHKIVQKKRANKEILEDKLMVDYFELTCKLTPERAQEELRYGDFPQDLCLNVCRKYKIQAGEAYLMEKSGSDVDAINLYFDIFIGTLTSLFQNDSALLTSQKQLTDFMMKKIQSCLDICREKNKKGEEESENNWFLLIIRITKLRQKYHYSQQGKIVFLCLNEVYQIILQEVLNKVELKSVLQNLEGLIGMFSLDEVKSTFQQLLNGYSYELFVLLQTLLMVKQDLQQMDSKFYLEQSRAVRIIPYTQLHRRCYVHNLCEQLIPFEEFKVNQQCTSCLDQPKQKIKINLYQAELNYKLSNQKKKMFLEDPKNQYQKESPQEDSDDQDPTFLKSDVKVKRINKWKEYDLQTESKWSKLYSL